MSVMRQKGESQNGCFKKVKHAKLSKNEHFLPPDTHMYMSNNDGTFFAKIYWLVFIFPFSARGKLILVKRYLGGWAISFCLGGGDDNLGKIFVWRRGHG